MKKYKTGLLFGSFNPIHLGHTIVASYLREFTDLEQVWFVVSPQNPLKDEGSLLEEHHRLMLVKTAIKDDPGFRASDIEFKMPRPSYTIDTLTWLSDGYPNREFVLIAGTDILESFHKWKNYNVLLEFYQVYIYNRPGYDPGKYIDHPSFRFFEAPLIEISSSFIRKAIANGNDVGFMLPNGVWKYITGMHFYA
jgi:nicotinate-nucleotide adenylyltransferase